MKNILLLLSFCFTITLSAQSLSELLSKSKTGYKTRHFDTILQELEHFFAIHKAEGTIPGGVHFELTGNYVTECVGGSQKIKEENLSDRYHTHCDPRLNASQGLDLAFKLSDFLKLKRG